MDNFQDNQYIPFPSVLLDVREENKTIKRFLVQLPDHLRQQKIIPGQFFQLSAIGYGEIPISVSDFDPEAGTIMFCIANTGSITTKFHQLSKDQLIGLRGPFGNGFPVTSFLGKNIVLLAGGIGLVPLRSVVSYFFRNPDAFNKIEILYGAKSTSDIIFRNEIKQWRLKPKTSFKMTIDNPEKGWSGNTGFVSNFLLSSYSEKSEILFAEDPEFKNTKVLVVGPPAMYKSVFNALSDIHFPDKEVLLSLENRMKCGIGKCGHCNCGSKYVCLDGPIFSWFELKNLPKEY